MRNVQRYGRRKRNMHVLLNTTKLYKKCVYKYRKRHYKRIFKKIIIVFTFIFLQNENLNNKKKKSAVCRFLHWKKYFPEFVFNFLHVSLPFAHRGWQRFFCCKLFASGSGQTRRINNTLRRTYDKNRYCKNCFCMLCKSDKIALFPRFVFDFFTVICPFAHKGWQRFFCKLFASGNGQARHINNTLHRTYDKNRYCKIVFACFAQATKLHFPFRRSSLRKTSTSATKLETLARKTFCLQTSKKFLYVQKLHTQRFVGQIRFLPCKKFVPFAKAARDGRHTLRLPQHVGKTRLFQFFVVADYRV